MELIQQNQHNIVYNDTNNEFMTLIFLYIQQGSHVSVTLRTAVSVIDSQTEERDTPLDVVVRVFWGGT